ncbi:MAG: peptidoglycan-binding protein [Ruminococcus sp.]|jgi:bacterioferritin|nr:peptidoglycan-binding protein [Ruminococcus sp.]
MKIITRDQPMDADMSPYHLPDPYPVPVNLLPNAEESALLSVAYAGVNSEMTALSQYVVHHETCADTNPDISHDILQIGIIEMFHLDMLGSCIKQLGGSVYMINRYGKPQYWTSKNIKYGNDLISRLKIDIQSENDCINSYRRIISRLKNPALIDLLARIIKDEELHITLFNQMIDKLSIPKSVG